MKNKIFRSLTIAVVVFMVSLTCLPLVQVAKADNSTPTVTTGNTAPVASDVILNSSSAITLTEYTTTSVAVTGTVTDNNSCNDLTSVKVVIYKQGTTCSAVGNVDNDDCYYYIDEAPANQSTCGDDADLTWTTSTTFQVLYYADPGTWVAEILPYDEGGVGSTDTDTQTLNELQALNVSASIDHGTVAAGQNSTGDHTATVTDTGNIAIDVTVSGGSLTCTTRTTAFTVNLQEYSTSTFSYGAGVDLTGSAVDMGVVLATTTNLNTPVTDVTYWQLTVPTGNEGTCTGTNTFLATVSNT